MRRLLPLLLLTIGLSTGCGDEPAEGEDTDDADDSDEDAPVDADGDGFDSVETGGSDCDDGDADIHPEADERCDGVDTNCDGLADPPVVLEADDGTVTDYGEVDFSDASAPATVAVEASGTLTFCESGTLYTSLQIAGQEVDLVLASEDLSVTLHGGELGTPLTLTGGATVEVQGLTIEGGAGYYGGCVHSSESDLTLTGVTISECVAGESGGAVWSQNGYLQVFDSTIANNEAPYGGALEIEGTVARIVDTLINQNDAADTNGGAIYLYYSNLSLEGGGLRQNTAAMDGGAIYSLESGGEIDGTTFANNTPHDLYIWLGGSGNLGSDASYEW